MLTRKIRIDLDPNSALAVVNCNQYDEIADCLEISLFKNSQAFTIPSGASVKIQGTKPDMHGFQYDAKSFSGNTVVCDLTQQMTAVAGGVPTEIRIFDTNENTAHSANFILQVEESALSDDTIMSDTEISGVETLKEIVARLDDVKQDVEAANAAAQRAETAASTAGTKASEAATSAESANASKDNANAAAEESEAWAVGKRGGVDVPATDDTYHNNSKYYAEQAGTNATNAANSAQAANTKATEAYQSAQTASTKADEASASATTASTKADEASASAQTASTKAGEATTAASTATSKATEATTAAQTATTKASEASTSAQTATTKATEAATSASNAATSETNAQNSATAANTKAEEASASADRAEQAAQSTEGTVRWSERKGYVGKNLLKQTLFSQTSNGVTFETQTDGGIVANGTPIDAVQYVTFWLAANFYLPKGKYILSGCPTGGSNSTFEISMMGEGTVILSTSRDFGQGVIIESQGENIQYVQCVVRHGYTANNLTFYPMIRYASITDDTYEPHLPKNDEIAKRVEVLEKENLLPNPLFSFINNGMPVQGNGIIAEQKADGSIVINGTATVDITLYVVSSVSPSSVTTDSEPRNHKFRLKENGTYTFTGAEGGSSTTYQLIINRQVVDRNYQAVNYGIDYGSGVVFNQTDNDGDIAVAIRIFAGYVCDNLTFKPMIVKGTNKQEYVPYKWDYTPTMLKRRLAYTIGGNALYETSIADIEIPEDLLVVGFASINTANGLIVRVKDEVVWGRRVLFAMKNTSPNEVSAEMVIMLNCIPRRPWEH